MKDLGKVITIIPAKGASKRLKRKNLALLAGKPLLAYPIETAMASGVCGEITVSTEDEEIANVARRYGANVPFLRPDYLAHDPYEAEDVCLHVLERYEQEGQRFDTLVLLLATAPFCAAKDVRECLRIFREHDGKFLMSVSRMHPHYYYAMRFNQDGMTMSPVFDDDHLHMRVRPPTPVRCNGAVTVMDVEAFREARTYYGKPLLGYEMPAERSIDVDTKDDLLYAEVLLQRGCASAGCRCDAGRIVENT